MRTKRYTKDFILKAAVKLVEVRGFDHFTARSLARSMNISTQPIYMEFGNMEEVKQETIQAIFDYLFEEIFSKVQTGDPVVDIALNMVEYAMQYPQMFKAIYVENYGKGKVLYQKSTEYFMKTAPLFDKYKDVPLDKLEALHIRIWITATGLAALSSSGILNPTKEEIIQLLLDFIEMMLANPNPVLMK